MLRRYPNGSGHEAYPDGSYYIGESPFHPLPPPFPPPLTLRYRSPGEFTNGVRHGIGRYVRGAIAYIGEWADGLRHGQGVERESRGDELLWIATVGRPDAGPSAPPPPSFALPLHMPLPHHRVSFPILAI